MAKKTVVKKVTKVAPPTDNSKYTIKKLGDNKEAGGLAPTKLLGKGVNAI